MSPLRWDVLLAGFVLSLPVLALGMRGDLTVEEVTTRMPVVPRRRLGSRGAAASRQHPADDGRAEAAPGGRARRSRRPRTASPPPPPDRPAAPWSVVRRFGGPAGLPERRTTPQSGRPQAIALSTGCAAARPRSSARHRPRVPDQPRPSPELRLRRDALRTGWSDGELERLVRAGELAGCGAAPTSTAFCRRRSRERHRLLVRATLAGLRRPAVVSHQSAAVLLGLPLWDVALDRVHVTRRRRHGRDRSGVLCVTSRGSGTTRSWRSDGVLVTDAGADRPRPRAFAAPRGGRRRPRCRAASAGC